MAEINVVWQSYHQPEVINKGYWDNGLLFDTFKQLDVKEYDDIKDLPDGEGAVFIINGRTHTEDAEQITKDLARLPWVLVMITGDEEASFPWRDVKHPLMKVWVMLPRMREHDDAHFYLPNGYRPDTRQLLKDIGQQEKQYDWFFAGQVNHPRREQCVQELKYLRNSGENVNGNLATTKRFGEEILPYPEYLKMMAQSKFVMCPSGIESPDNFRVYEALEAGCIPIVDAFSTKHQHPGFWQYLFGNDIPFPIVDYWDVLPRMLPELLKDWEARANRCFAWWQDYKLKLKYQLLADVKELSK